jgi:translation initiation factor IF-2
MAEEVKKDEKVAPAKAVKTEKVEVKAEVKVEAKAQVKAEPVVTPKAEVKEEPKPELKPEPKAETPKEEKPAVEELAEELAEEVAEEEVEEEVEIMGKRGRKSAAEKAAALEHKKQVLADTFSVMINNEPWRADVYREQYRARLAELK